jgi:uncharacterized membrane protein YfcA
MEILGFLVTGLIVGSISGALGIGGGVLLIPILMWVFQFDHRTANGTTLAVLCLPVFWGAVVNYYREDLLNVQAAFFIACGFAVGAFFSSMAVPYVPHGVLRILFALLLLYMGILLFFSHPDVRSASLALVIVGLSWLAFLGLKILGRHYRPRDLGKTIEELHKPDSTEPDYYI